MVEFVPDLSCQNLGGYLVYQALAELNAILAVEYALRRRRLELLLQPLRALDLEFHDRCFQRGFAYPV